MSIATVILEQRMMKEKNDLPKITNSYKINVKQI